MIRRNIVRLFETRKGNLEYRINRDYIRNGIATIPCRINNYDEVISTYSVKGYETLNTEFIDYVRTTAAVTPDDCPIILNIIEDCLTEDQRKTIAHITKDDFSYDLGVVERDEKRHVRTFILMFVGLVILGVILWLSSEMGEVPRELIFIMFWFMGDTLCDYLFLAGRDLRRERRLAGRLASIKVIFTKDFEKPDYSDNDVEKIYSDIEKEVNDTLQQ